LAHLNGARWWRKQLFVDVGSFHPIRENFRLTPEVKAKFTKKLRVDPQDFFGRRVTQAVRKDGLKLVFEGGAWVCYRLSGTELVVRVYSEASSQQALEKLSAAAKQWIFE
jgi:phosphomannomutase